MKENAVSAFIKGQEQLATAERNLAAAQAAAQAQAQQEAQRQVVSSSSSGMDVGGAIREIAGDIAETALDNVGSVMSGIKEIRAKLQDDGGFFGRLADNLSGMRETAGSKISSLGEAVGEKVTAVGESVSEGLSSAGEAVADVGGAVLDGAGAVVEGAAEAAGAVIGAIAD